MTPKILTDWRAPVSQEDRDLRKREAALQSSLTDLEVRRRGLGVAMTAERATVARCHSPAAGAVGERTLRQAEAISRHAQLKAEDTELATKIETLRTELSAVREALKPPAAPAKTDDELKRDLAKAERLLETVTKEAKRANDRAAEASRAEFFAGERTSDLFTRSGPDVATMRAKAVQQAREAREAGRAARRVASERLADVATVLAAIADLEGELDRRQRQWSPPQPIAIPVLPDPRLPDDERAEALVVLVPQLELRRRRASERLHEAETRRNGSRGYGNTLTSAGVFKARHADFEAEYRQRLSDFAAVNARLLAATGELRRLEILAVV
jgi:hypothetical protein